MRVYSAVIVGALVVLTFCSLVFTVSFAMGFLPESLTAAEIVVRPNETFNFSLIIVYRQGMEISLFLRDNSLTYARAAPTSTINAWETGFFRLDLESQETYDLSAVLYSPDGTILDSRNVTNRGGGPYWMSFGPHEITTAGRYRLEVKNNGAGEMHGTLRANVMWERFERPLFYVGVGSLVILLLYPAIMLVTLLRKRKPSSESQAASASRLVLHV